MSFIQIMLLKWFMNHETQTEKKIFSFIHEIMFHILFFRSLVSDTNVYLKW